MVSRFSSLASFIRLGGFSPSPYFTSTIPCSTELASEEGGNCNNMTSGKFLKWKSQTESSQSGSHMITIIQNFILVSLTSSMTPHLVGLPLGVAVTSLLTHLFPYALISLRTCLLMHLSYCYICIPAGKTFCLGIYLRSSTCQNHLQLSQYATKKLSCWLDAIDALLLCGSQLSYQSTRVTGWMTSGHF